MKILLTFTAALILTIGCTDKAAQQKEAEQKIAQEEAAENAAERVQIGHVMKQLQDAFNKCTIIRHTRNGNQSRTHLINKFLYF